MLRWCHLCFASLLVADDFDHLLIKFRVTGLVFCENKTVQVLIGSKLSFGYYFIFNKVMHRLFLTDFLFFLFCFFVLCVCVWGGQWLWTGSNEMGLDTDWMKLYTTTSSGVLSASLNVTAALERQSCCSVVVVFLGGFHIWFHMYWAGLLTPLTFAQHRLSPLVAFTPSACFLHSGRQWQWICKFYTANFKGTFGGL